MADRGEKATTAALLSPIFWLQGHRPNQKSLWELFTQDGTDQPHWLMDYMQKGADVMLDISVVVNNHVTSKQVHDLTINATVLKLSHSFEEYFDHFYIGLLFM